MIQISLTVFFLEFCFYSCWLSLSIIKTKKFTKLTKNHIEFELKFHLAALSEQKCLYDSKTKIFFFRNDYAGGVLRI